MVGPSGCGKTSLLNLAAGLLMPSKGRVTYAGKPVTGPRQDIAIVFQDYGKALLPWRTAAGNISLALEAIDYPQGPARDADRRIARSDRAVRGMRINFRTSSRAACSSGCRSRAAWRRTRRCC